MTSLHGEPIQILHVDDDPSVTDLTATFLERDNNQFAVQTVASAAEGLELIGDRPLDCIVSDYNMPGMDGLEFLQAVREEYPDLPFILFTGKGSETVASDAIAAGVTDYIQKNGGTERYDLLANRIENAVQSRREANRAAKQEQLMRLTELTADTGGFEIDLDTDEVLLTEGAHRLAGLSEKTDLTLEDAIGFYYPDDQTALREMVAQVAETGDQAEGVFRFQRPDGEDRLVEMTLTPATDAAEDSMLRGVVNDVTEQDQRKRALEQERRVTDQALDALNDAFYVLDTDGSFRRWNSKVPEITGYTDQQLADMDAVELFPPDEREALATAIETALTEGRATVEADIQTAAGERVSYEFIGARLTDTEGKTTGLAGIGRDLTERGQRERRFQALVEESNDIISIIDAEGVFQYQSPSIERILGYNPTDPIGDTAWEYVHPDDRADLIEAFERGVADSGANPVNEYRARHADGSWRWQEARGNNQLDNPAVEGYVINSRDITDRKEREQELSLFFDESLLGAIQWDEEFRFEQINDRAEELLGYSETELRGESWERIVADDDRERVGDVVESLLDADGGRRVINDNIRKDGETVTCEWHNRVVTDANGAVRSVFSEFQDITEREQRKRELQEYETVIEALSDAVYVVDERGRFRYVNDEFSNLVGYDRETIIGNTPSLIKNEDAVQQVEGQLDRLLSHDGPETASVEVTIQPRTGEPIVCEDHMGVLLHDGEGFNGSVGVLRDITKQRQYEQELEAQNERLGEFASIVSHDLRNPLSVAEGYLELAENGDENGHLDKAANAIERSQALIDDLLTLAREGDQVDEVESVGLGKVAKQSWQTTETAQATLNVDESEVIEVDRGRLRELFENLYRNAVEHGDDDVTVHVGSMEGGFYVADTGSGVPESARAEIFEAGYSTTDDGTGFGLRIVEQIAQAHGWEVSVTESREGGARFDFTGVQKVSD